MAQAKRKLSRKELKQPDEFQSRGQAVLQQLIDNKKKYLTYLGVVLAIMAIYAGVMSWRNSVAEDHSKQFSDAMIIYNAQVTDNPADANPAGDPPTFNSNEMKYLAAGEKFEKLIQDQGSSPFAVVAQFYLGNSMFMLKRYEKAREYYEAFVDDASGALGELEFLALNNIAQSYDAEENLDKALETYKKITDEKDDVWAPQAMYFTAQIYKRQNKNDDAIQLLLKLQEDYPDSSVKTKVDKLLTVLRGPAPEEPKADKAEDGEGKGD